LDNLCRPGFVAGVPGLIKKIKTVKTKVSHILRPGIPHSKNSLSLVMVSNDSVEGYMR
jgi:hypothetical protein